MSQTYIGKRGKTYTILEPPLGRGGEGEVFRIENQPDLVMKVYRKNLRTESREKKIQAMVKIDLGRDALDQISWPLDMVYQGADFVGFVMPLIKNNLHINAMYTPGQEFNLKDRIAVGKNLCAAINSIHAAHQVCGDLNPNNIIVDPKNGLVTMIDTDSYHIKDFSTNQIYRCPVGEPHFLPPEVQEKMKNGMDLVSAPLPTFTRESDLFALAVHIFSLLMNGCHPFACAVDGNLNMAHGSVARQSISAFQPIDNITNNFFPFYDKKPGITIPKYAPDLSVLPLDLKNLFIQAFKDGYNNPKSRPDPVTWYKALDDYGNNLEVCPRNKDHYYYKKLSSCPWCQVEKDFHSLVSQGPVGQVIKQNPVNIKSSSQTTRTQTRPKQASQTTRTQTRPRPRRRIRINKTFLAFVLLVIVTLGLKYKYGGWESYVEDFPVLSKLEDKFGLGPEKEPEPILQTEDFVSLSIALPYEESRDNNSFKILKTCNDTLGNSYLNGVTGVFSDKNWAVYKVNQDYKELRGRVILNQATYYNKDQESYVWIYGDGINIYMSDPVTTGFLPQDFVLDISEYSTVKIVIKGSYPVILVDTGFYKNSETETITTIQPPDFGDQDILSLKDLTPFYASREPYFWTNLEDNQGNSYHEGLGVSYGGEVTYYLGGEFNRFTGTAILENSYKSSTRSGRVVAIYKDGDKGFKSQPMVAGYMPEEIDIDLSGAEYLSINFFEEEGGFIANPYLYKNDQDPVQGSVQEKIDSSKKKIYLSDLEAYNDVGVSNIILKDSVVDNLGNSYPNCLYGVDHYWGAVNIAKYKLGQNYSSLSGRVILQEGNTDLEGSEVRLRIYGDGDLLFQSDNVAQEGYQGQDFFLDISGVDTLEVQIDKSYYIGLVDCILEK